MNEKKNVDRNPREVIGRPEATSIIIDPPPKIEKKDKEKIYPVIIQCIVAVVNFSLISFIVSKDINTSLLCTVISSVGSLFSILITNQIERKKAQEKNKENDAKYIDYLTDVGKEIDSKRASFDAYYASNYPSLHSCIKGIELQPLWDRFIGESDFLLVRIGYHYLREFDVTCQSNLFIESDSAITATVDEIKMRGYTDAAPVLLDINNRSIGFWGTEDALFQMFFRILIDCTFHHCYTDVKFVVIEPDGIWGWLSALGFFQDSSVGRCLYASTHKEVTNVLTYIDGIKTKRENSLLPDRADSSTPIPHYIICVFDDKAEKLQAFNSIAENKGVSISLLYFYKNYYMLPDCVTKIKCEMEEAILLQRAENVRFKTETIDQNEMKRYVSFLSSFQCESVSDFSIPVSTSIFDGYGIMDPNDLDIINRWKKSTHSTRIAIPVGIGGLGQIFTMDLHEAEDGPHCLVTGSTGSGKSEFLTTMVLSYAINYPPQKVSFWFIDLKGGGIVAPLKKLPHICKAVTQFGQNQFSELCNSLGEELKRRQRLLYECHASFEEYNRTKNSLLPHLFIIVDDLATIINFPEYKDFLYRAINIGRSLGIHLVLATQGSVEMIGTQILACCRSKICFRARDKGHSLSILDDPIASTFPSPGRAAIRIGDDMFSVFQSFWCEANSKMKSAPQSEVLAEYISEIYSTYCKS